MRQAHERLATFPSHRIVAMPLYVDIHRIENELAALGIAPDQPIAPEQLFPLDQLPYHGTDAVRAAAGLIGLGRDTRVLDVGSGLGGPARYLAHTLGCRVTALALQPELHDLASALTRRTGLEARVTHVLGDALTYPLEAESFDAVVSWLTIHHTANRRQLLQRLARALHPGGRIYIEDFVERAPFLVEDADDLKRALAGATITPVDLFEADLREAGFDDLEALDMTGSWAQFCASRTAAFRRDRVRHVRVHGEATAARLERVFSTEARLLAGGGLGGVRLAARLTS